jgi:hypothetical protein
LADGTPVPKIPLISAPRARMMPTRGSITPLAGGGPLNHPDDAALENYPHGRGYGHDYMRGGEVLGGYGYAERDEYSKSRGDLTGTAPEGESATDTQDEPTDNDYRT